MKNVRRLFIAALSLVLFSGFLPSPTASARAIFLDSIEPPEGYVLLDDGGYFQYAMGESYIAYEYPASGSIIFSYSHKYNYTVFRMDVENEAAFFEIYDVYKDALDFDVQTDNRRMLNGEIQDLSIINIILYDNLDADGNLSYDPADFEDKYDLILEMTQELKAADLLLAASYQGCYALGIHAPSLVYVDGMTEEDENAVSEIIADYGGTLEYIENDLYPYLIVDVTAFSEKMAMKEEIEAQIPGTTVWINSDFEMTTIDLSSAEGEIDLLTAEPEPDPPVATGTTSLSTGDIDGDGDITLQDAYQALVAYASVSAGLELELTEEQQAAADVDGDGAITIADAFKILIYYATEAVGRTPSWD